MASFYEELNQRDAVSDERENSESRKKWINGFSTRY